MNKVSIRCQKQSNAKFYYASQKMFGEVKLLKIGLYLLAVVPVVLQFIPAMNTNDNLSFLYTVLSFAITILNEVLSSFFSNHKENAILEHQMYESEITGSTLSKTEYDREMTNNLHELAIRKGLPKMRDIEEDNKEYHSVVVPDEISDDYSYLYLCRTSAAKTNFILGRMFVFYVLLLTFVIVMFIACMFWKQNTADYLKLIIGFYPLVIPFIRNCMSCKKTQRNCVKICADIDNYFSDGDASVERLARFYYYTQNIEFEMMTNRPAIYNIFNKMFKHGLEVLEAGVTLRFEDSINELYGKSKGLVTQARGKGLITRVDYDLEKIQELERKKKLQKAQAKKAVELEKKALEEENLVSNTKKATNTSKSTLPKSPTTAKKTTTTAKKTTTTKEPVKKTTTTKKNTQK